MFLAEIPPQFTLRFIERKGQKVLQQKVVGGIDFRDYTTWIDVPFTEETEGKEFITVSVCD